MASAKTDTVGAITTAEAGVQKPTQLLRVLLLATFEEINAEKLRAESGCELMIRMPGERKWADLSPDCCDFVLLDGRRGGAVEAAQLPEALRARTVVQWVEIPPADRLDPFYNFGFPHHVLRVDVTRWLIGMQAKMNIGG